MTPFTEAFDAARETLAAYRPAADVPLGVTLVPARRRPAAAGAGTSAEHPVAGPLLRAAQRLRARETTCSDLVTAALAAIERDNPRTHAVVEVLTGQALAEAAALDAEIAREHWRGSLHGIPITVKDNVDVLGATTRAGSDAYEQAPTRDATVVARLRAAGAIVVAKATTHEFALGVTTPQARHPLDERRISGGSSGGSAISVRTGMALGSVGTDTRASIRVPASLCGVVGFKPTFGLVPTDGVVVLSWTMDHVGMLAGSVADAACLVEAAVGGALDGCAQAAVQSVADLRVGIPEPAFDAADPEVDRAVRSAIAQLASLGAELVPVPTPSQGDMRLANAAGLLVSRCEARTYHDALDTDLARTWPETRDQLGAAAAIPAVDYIAAQRYRSDLANRLIEQAVSLRLAALAIPTTLVTAPFVADADRYFTLLSRNAIPWSFVGWPALSIPCGTSADGLPVGLQLVAPPYEEATLVRLGAALERAGVGTPAVALPGPR